MRNKLLYLVLPFLIAACSSQVQLTGRSAPGSISLGPEREPPAPLGQPEQPPAPRTPEKAPTLPAHLVLVEKRFEEPGGNRALDGGETGTLVLEVRNDGLGPGKIGVRLTPLSDMDHLDFERYLEAGLLPVGESRTLRLSFAAGGEVMDGNREVRVELTEEYNRATIPFTFSFVTRGLVPAEFRVIVRDYDDGRFFAGNSPDGLIQAGEMVKVVANVQNVGGDAEQVVLEVAPEGADVRYTRDLRGNADNRFELGQMVSGSNQDIEFYFFTTPVFPEEKVRLTLKVNEGSGRFGKEEELSFDIGQSVQTEAVLAVAAVQEKAGSISMVKTDLIDIEEIPQNSQTRLENGIAIIFGIEEYKYTFPATYKTRDARTFFRYCRDVLGIPEERIMLRMNEDATKAEFDYIFEPRETPNQGWLKKRLRNAEEAGKTDIFVYLAGHGFPDLSTGSPYLIPHDVRPEQTTNGVGLEKLYQTLSDFGAGSVTVFVESCFSGASGYDREGSEKLLALNMNPVFPVIEQPMIGPTTVVFTATGGKKPSNNRDDLKHGIFSYFLLKGLGGAADADGNRGVNVEELFRYLEREVPRKALEAPLDREQVPQILPSPERLGERGKRVLVQY